MRNVSPPTDSTYATTHPAPENPDIAAAGTDYKALQTIDPDTLRETLVMLWRAHDGKTITLSPQEATAAVLSLHLAISLLNADHTTLD